MNTSISNFIGVPDLGFLTPPVIIGSAIVIIVIVVISLLFFFNSPERSAETWYLRAPLPKKHQMVVYDALNKIKSARYHYIYGERRKDIEAASDHLAAIDKDVRRYYRALNGRADMLLAFVKIESFANKTVANYDTLVGDIRYADRRALAICIGEIQLFAAYAFAIAERAVSEEHSATYGAIQMRYDDTEAERELEALVASKGFIPTFRVLLKAAHTAFVRKVP